MKVTYKLVGIKGDYHFSKDHDISIDLDTLNSDIRNIGFDGEISKIIFIAKSQTIKNTEKKFNEDTIVFVFSKHTDIKIKLKNAFENNCDKGPSPVSKSIDLSSGSSNNSFTMLPRENINKPIEIKIPTLDDDAMIQHNTEVLSKLKSNNFKTLMQIYHNDPELLQFWYNYVSSGNIVDASDIEDKCVEEELSEAETLVLSEIKTLVTEFGFNIEDDSIKKLIRKFDGNCSLIFRYIYQINLNEGN
tara:strand:+ start:779 stop:1516 length:738 start_codon:yes stop_codon:yes gene_type:complete